MLDLHHLMRNTLARTYLIGLNVREGGCHKAAGGLIGLNRCPCFYLMLPSHGLTIGYFEETNNGHIISISYILTLPSPHNAEQPNSLH